MSISAAFTNLANEKIYFFSGSEYFRFDIASAKTDRGYPRPIHGNWKGLWAHGIDAAFEKTPDYFYFFRGSEYLLYDRRNDQVQSGYPRSIADNWKDVWAKDIDAAVNWNGEKVYFFKGGDYIRYDLANGRVDPDYPKSIAKFWRGVWDKGIDAVLRVPHKGKAYFFKGDQYIRYDISADRADPNYPRSIAPHWLGLAPLHRMTAFDPATHGFQFANSFDLKPKMFGVTNQDNWQLGLCGGMCSAALDRFLEGRPIPKLDHPPAHKGLELDLFWELFGRQVATLYPDTWAKVLRWHILPEKDDSGIETTARTIADLFSQI